MEIKDVAQTEFLAVINRDMSIRAGSYRPIIFRFDKHMEKVFNWFKFKGNR